MLPLCVFDRGHYLRPDPVDHYRRGCPKNRTMVTTDFRRRRFEFVDFVDGVGRATRHHDCLPLPFHSHYRMRSFHLHMVLDSSGTSLGPAWYAVLDDQVQIGNMDMEAEIDVGLGTYLDGRDRSVGMSWGTSWDIGDVDIAQLGAVVERHSCENFRSLVSVVRSPDDSESVQLAKSCMSHLSAVVATTNFAYYLAILSPLAD